MEVYKYIIYYFGLIYCQLVPTNDHTRLVDNGLMDEAHNDPALGRGWQSIYKEYIHGTKEL